MLSSKPHVARWNQTDDVLQNAMIRLYRALKAVKPDSKRVFNALAATQIRRELIDMARSLYGPHGLGRNHHTDSASDDQKTPSYEAFEQSPGVIDQVAMLEFHESVGKLESDWREVFELIFYQGMTQAEVAILLDVSERTVKRRWREARLRLSSILGAD